MKLAEFNQNYEIDRKSRGLKAVEKSVNLSEKKHKYRAERAIFEGIVFDSKKEAKRFGELQLLEAHGAIENLESNAERIKKKLPKIRYELIKRNGNREHYEPDFEYLENGQKIVEDSKGYKTEVYKRKKRLMLKQHGIEIRES